MGWTPAHSQVTTQVPLHECGHRVQFSLSHGLASRPEQRCSVMWPQSCLTAAARSCVYTQSATRKWDRNNETLQESPNNDRDTPIATNTILRSYKTCTVFLRIVFKVLTSAKLLRSQAESIKKSLHGSYTLQECPSTYQLHRSIPTARTLYSHYIWLKKHGTPTTSHSKPRTLN